MSVPASSPLSVRLAPAIQRLSQRYSRSVVKPTAIRASRLPGAIARRQMLLDQICRYSAQDTGQEVAMPLAMPLTVTPVAAENSTQTVNTQIASSKSFNAQLPNSLVSETTPFPRSNSQTGDPNQLKNLSLNFTIAHSPGDRTPAQATPTEIKRSALPSLPLPPTVSERSARVRVSRQPSAAPNPTEVAANTVDKTNPNQTAPTPPDTFSRDPKLTAAAKVAQAIALPSLDLVLPKPQQRVKATLPAKSSSATSPPSTLQTATRPIVSEIPIQPLLSPQLALVLPQTASMNPQETIETISPARFQQTLMAPLATPHSTQHLAVPPIESATAPAVNLSNVVRQVDRLMTRRSRIEQERRGRI